LKNGQIVETKNFRPFKARRHIKQENSIFDIALIPEIYIYPGDLNPRARWDDFQTRAVEANDFQIIFEKAETSLEDVAKKVKNQIKNPLAAKEPAVLLSFKKICLVTDQFLLIDHSDERIILSCPEDSREKVQFDLFKLIGKENLLDGVILLRFFHNFEDSTLRAIPLSIIQRNKIIRLSY
jgi:hypothetical protein